MIDLLSKKPPKEVIFNSITVKENYFEESCKKEIALNKKQKEENDKLKPTLELLKQEFTI